MPSGARTTLLAKFSGTRFWLSTGQAEPMIENLPGFPDNMALGSDGLLWVSLASGRNALLDRLLPLPGVLRQLSWLLPDRLRPGPAATVWVLALSWDGAIVHDRQATVDGFSMVTSAIEHDGTVYLGSLHAPAIAAFEF